MTPRAISGTDEFCPNCSCRKCEAGKRALAKYEADVKRWSAAPRCSACKGKGFVCPDCNNTNGGCDGDQWEGCEGSSLDKCKPCSGRGRLLSAGGAA